MKLIINISIVCSLFFSCSNEVKKESLHISEKKESTIQLEDSIFCASCKFSFPLPDSNSFPNNETISTPIAIEFFHLMNMIGKYDGKKNCVDSLPKKLRNSGRQEIYRTMDQYWAYKYFIQPELNSLRVKTIKSDYKCSLITFLINGQPTSFKLDYFKDNDGLLLYTPNKKPIIWTTESNNKACDEKTFIRCYFTN